LPYYKDEIVPAPPGILCIDRQAFDDNCSAGLKECTDIAESLLKHDAIPVVAFRIVIEKFDEGGVSCTPKVIAIPASNGVPSKEGTVYALIFPNGLVQIGLERWAILADALHDYYINKQKQVLR
jgi:hypothetical protein